MKRRDFLGIMGKGSASLLLPQQLVRWLEVNTDDTVRKIRYATEAVGRRELAALCKTSEFEDAWVYLPRKGLWIETGTDSYSDLIAFEFRMGVMPDRDFEETLFAENDEVQLYHIHPIGPKEFVKDGALFETAFESEQYRHRDVIPSEQDLQSLVYSYNTFRRCQPDGIFSYHIVSEFGITTVDFTAEAKLFPPEHSFWKSVPGEDTKMSKTYAVACKGVESFDIEKVLENIQVPYFTITFCPLPHTAVFQRQKP